MPRFYVDFALSPDSVVELPDNVVHHLNVLRVKKHGRKSCCSTAMARHIRLCLKFWKTPRQRADFA